MQKKTAVMGMLLVLFCGKIFSDDAPPLTNPAPKIWRSLNSQDTITFENAGGQEMQIEISVDDDQTVPGVTGIVVYNCDDDNPKQNLDAGSSITCLTHDPDNPVKVESDSASKPASGTVIMRTR